MQTSAASPARLSSFAGLAATLPGRLLIGLSATLIVAAAAHVAIPLPFTPVPLTLQPLAVLGVGLALGPVAGFLTMLAYLAEGVLGLPVFSPTGPGGIAQLLGPTGGFLLAYPLVALLAGGVTQVLTSRIPRFIAAVAGGAVATALLFLSGALWLMHLAHLSVHGVWIAAIAPFLPGEAVKILVAAGIYKALVPTAAGKPAAPKLRTPEAASRPFDPGSLPFQSPLPRGAGSLPRDAGAAEVSPIRNVSSSTDKPEQPGTAQAARRPGLHIVPKASDKSQPMVAPEATKESTRNQ